MRVYWDALRKFDRDVIAYLVMWGTVGFGYFGIIGVLFSLYLLQLGYQPDFIGRLIGMGQIAWGVFALPAGALGARWGVKEAQVVGILGTAAGTFVLIAAAWMPPEWRPVMLAGGWIFSWIGAAFSAVNSTPYLMAVTNDQNRSLAFTVQAVVFSLTGFAGSLVAGVLPQLLADRLPAGFDPARVFALAMLVAPLGYLIGAFAITRVRRVALAVHAATESEPAGLPLGILGFLVIIIMLQAYGEGSVRAFFNVYLASGLHGTTQSIGVLMGFGQLLPILFLMATPPVLQRWKTATALGITTLMSFTFLLLMGEVPGWGAAGVAYVGVMGSVAMAGAIRSIYSQEIVAPRWRSISSAIATIGLAAGWAASAWIGGVLAQSVGFRAVFLLGAALTLLSVGVLVVQAQIDQSRAKRAATTV